MLAAILIALHELNYVGHCANLRSETLDSYTGIVKKRAWFNSPTERFFRSLKYEQLHYEKFRTLAEAKLSVIDYLAFYNGKRIQRWAINRH
jgi:hypothetical protein